MLDCGSSGIIQRVSPGVALKQPFVYLGQTEVDERVANCFSVEKQILKRLGHHPRIIPRTSGRWYSPSRGQPWQPPGYLDSHPSASLGQRLAWCRQVAEAIDCIHSRGVVHSDLRPGNILVHETTPGARDLQLCDFGGSVCQELGLDGFSLPDGPFYSPVFENKTSTLLDIFGMGSIFYTILTGRWPYKTTPGRFAKVDDRLDWEERIVYPNFKAGKFPDVEQLPGGGCHTKVLDEAVCDCTRSFVRARRGSTGTFKAWRLETCNTDGWLEAASRPGCEMEARETQPPFPSSNIQQR